MTRMFSRGTHSHGLVLQTHNYRIHCMVSYCTKGRLYIDVRQKIPLSDVSLVFFYFLNLNIEQCLGYRRTNRLFFFIYKVSLFNATGHVILFSRTQRPVKVDDVRKQKNYYGNIVRTRKKLKIY